MNKLTVLVLVMMISVNVIHSQEFNINDKFGPQPFGVNLAGAEFGGTSNGHGEFGVTYTYPTPAELDYFAAKGFRLIRLPFKWERLQHKVYQELNADELNRLKSFVAEAEKRGMYIILDLHNYARRNHEGANRIIGTGGLTVDHLADFWRKLATEMKPFSNIYGHGLMNEPYDLDPGTTWFEMAQASIYAIREVDTQNTIIVGGDDWSSAERWIAKSDTLKYLVDPADNLMFEAHVYFDKDASGSYRSSYDEEGCSPFKGVERVQPFANWLKVNGFRGMIGEYGVPRDDERWLVTMDHFLSYLQRNGITATYWAAGPWWGNYKLSIAPRNGEDREQMKVVEKYLFTEPLKNKCKCIVN